VGAGGFSVGAIWEEEEEESRKQTSRFSVKVTRGI
jgi:hypothetical protein